MNDWRASANCQGMSPGLFFPEKGNCEQQIKEARAVCAGCEVRSECLEEAMASGTRFGLWGGLTTQERRKLRRARRNAA